MKKKFFGFFGKSVAGNPPPTYGSTKGTKLSEADAALFGPDITRTTKSEVKEKITKELSLLDIDSNRKLYGAAGAGALGGAGYLGMGHQGKQGKKKKKDDTLKFLGY